MNHKAVKGTMEYILVISGAVNVSLLTKSLFNIDDTYASIFHFIALLIFGFYMYLDSQVSKVEYNELSFEKLKVIKYINRTLHNNQFSDRKCEDILIEYENSEKFKDSFLNNFLNKKR